MARIVLTSTLADAFTGGEVRFTVDAIDIRSLLRQLDTIYPGLGKEIDRSQGVAIDGEFYQDPLAQKLHADAEVFVLPKIAGG